MKNYFLGFLSGAFTTIIIKFMLCYGINGILFLIVIPAIITAFVFKKRDERRLKLIKYFRKERYYEIV